MPAGDDCDVYYGRVVDMMEELMKSFDISTYESDLSGNPARAERVRPHGPALLACRGMAEDRAN